MILPPPPEPVLSQVATVLAPSAMLAQTPVLLSIDAETIERWAAMHMVARLPYGVRAIAASGVRFGIVHTPKELTTWLASQVPTDATGVYITLNPLLAGTSGAGRDEDVWGRVWLLVDIDPVRPVDTSSTDDEMRAAVDHGFYIARILAARGWPGTPRIVMSGNGAHVLYRLPDLPNCDDSTRLVRSVLAALAKEFNTDALKIDTSVSNASRIVRVPGTWARKGAHATSRPHRQAYVLQEAA